MNRKRVAIVGCGLVGSTIAYTLMLKGTFSEMVLIDLDFQRAQGEAMDISHGVPFNKQMKIIAGDYSETKNADVIIVAAGGNQKPGESRTDLTERNILMIRDIIPRIMQYSYNGIILIVSNPVDILTYEAWRISGLPRNKVIGSGTVLDSARLKYLIGRKISVDSRSIHAFIIGEHGDSEIAVWSQANVSGIPLKLFYSMSGMSDDIEQEVRDCAYEIIQRKKATYYGIGTAVNRICEAIVGDEDSLMPVSTVLNGEYDISGVALSVPCIIGATGLKKYVALNLNAMEYDALVDSSLILKKIINEYE